MSDRIDPFISSAPPGPWPAVTDTSRLYDHGQPWCVNAAAHPDRNAGYPDRDRHMPWHECRTRETYLDSALLDLDGDPVGISAYAAAPFRFGQPRTAASASAPRIVVESWPREADGPALRFSLDAAQALRLARNLVHLADQLTFGWS